MVFIESMQFGQNTSDNLNPADNTVPILKKTDEVLRNRELSTLIYTKSIAGDTMIWGNPDFGIWGSYKWGNSANTSFILGHSIAGILGTCKLGSQASVNVLASVTNPNQQFIENFKTTTFKDTGVTTADWAVISGELSFTVGEIAQSNSVAYNDGTINSATLTATLSAGVIGNLTIELCANGSTFEGVTNATEHNFTATGTNLKFKITSAGNVTITQITISYGA